MGPYGPSGVRGRYRRERDICQRNYYNGPMHFWRIPVTKSIFRIFPALACAAFTAGVHGQVTPSTTAIPSVPARTMDISPGVAATGPASAATKPKGLNLTLELDPKALDMEELAKNHLSYMPAAMLLVDEKPAAIKKEPVYKSQPKYGAIALGNGPRSITYFSVDEPKGETGKLYVDINQNGDLSDDGSGEWNQATDRDGTLNYRSTVILRASWGSAIKEEESGNYGVMLYKRHGDARGGYVKTAARAGKMEIGGKMCNFLLVENTSDAIFTLPAKIDRTRRPVQFMVDLNGDGLFTGVQEKVDDKTIITREVYTLGEPINLGGQWWMILPNASGSNMLAAPAAAPTEAVAESTFERLPLLAAGVAAPDFTAQSVDGKPIKLSDFKGKVVILDFWATWCGPCKESMPGLQKIYDEVRDQGVVVVSLNVWDAKDPFDAWIKINSGTTYNFTFAFDPLGREKGNIAASMFNVSGIPTMYIIGRDGKIAAALVGSGNEKNIVKALNAQGIKTKE
jgi:thiol-disulfide isomerase/thioredoxin